MSDKRKIYFGNDPKNDLTTLSVIYISFFDELYSYGMKFCQNEYLVKDAVQDVFVGLIENKSNLEITKNLKAYIFRAIRNKILEELRAQKKKSEIEKIIFYSSPETLHENIEQRYIFSEEDRNRQKTVQLALNQLPWRQREVIHLRFTNNYDYEQIAKIMGITVPSARTLVFRAIKKLKRTIFSSVGESYSISSLQY